MSRSKRVRHQRGVISIIAALMLAVLVTAMLLFALRDSDTAINDTLNQDDSTAALFLAESGLERAANLLTSGAACDASLISSHALGKGGFDVAAGQGTGFDGLTALPTGQCRIQVTGTIANKSTRRVVQGIIDYTGGGASVIAYDSGSSTRANGTNLLVWTHTTSGSNRLLVVGVSLRNNSNQTVTGITYAGVALASIISQVHGGVSMRVEQWYLAAPALGANQIIVSLSGNARVAAGAVSLTGADQTPAAVDATGSAQGSGFFIALANVPLTTLSNNVWIVDTLVSRRSSVLPLSGQTLRWDVQTTGGGNFRIRGSGSTLGPIVNPGTQNLRWLVVSANAQWAIAATAIAPAATAPPGLLSWREITQ